MTGSRAQSPRLPEPIRFLLAGGGAAAVNWLVRIPLSLAMPYPAAVFCAALIGMAVGFAAYRAFVFPGSARPVSRQLRDFLLVNLASSLLVTGAAWLGRGLLLPWLAEAPAEAAAHAGAIALGAFANYLGHRRLTFGDRLGAPAGAA